MKGTEFEIGKIYGRDTSKSKVDIYTKKKPNEVINLSEKYCGEKNTASGLDCDYKEISFDDLGTLGKAKYVELFSSSQSCTCNIQDIMTKGCICGWLEKERA